MKVSITLSLITMLAATSMLSAATISEGYRTTDSDVVATDGWMEASGGFQIAWEITDAGSSAFPIHYKYTISNADGKGLPDANLSHIILEVSSTFTAKDIDKAIAPKTYEPTDTSGAQPYMPDDIWGIKFEPFTGDGPYVIEFNSTRLPTWGDFYAKDGKHDGVFATACNSSFGTNPTSATTDFSGWIMVPDTVKSIPLPGASWAGVFMLGGLGTVRVIRHHNRK